MRDRAELRVAAVVGVLLCCACTEVQNKSAAAIGGGKDRGDASADDESGATGGRSGEGGGGSAARAGEGPEPGGSGGSDGSGGTDSAGGSSGSVGSGSAGSGGSRGEAGMAAAAGSSGAAGVPAAGSGGEPASGTVRGTLIDALRRPLANVELRIGDRTTSTDGLGKFAADGVGATYDVGFKLSTIVDQMPTTYAWRFEGLTRRDPTLQVYPSSELQQSRLTWHTQGTTFPLPERQILLAGFGSEDGDFAAEVNQPDYESPIVYWTGGERTVGTTRMLAYTVAADQDLPLEYLAHDAKSVTLTVGEQSDVTFQLANTKPTVGSIAGRVNALGQGDRSNWLVLRWTDGTSLVVGDDSSGSEAFSYFVPTIANMSAAVVAFRGRPNTPPFAAAFADNLAAGTSDIQIDVPLAPSVIAPGAATGGVTSETMFQWSGDAKVFVFVAEAGGDEQGYDAMYVVTAAKQTRLPVVPAVPYAAPAGTEFNWRVETHGAYASVDDACADAGLISAFYDGRLHGPRRGPGSYTTSEARAFTTAK